MIWTIRCICRFWKGERVTWAFERGKSNGAEGKICCLEWVCLMGE